MKSDKPIVCLDIETTDASIDTAETIQFAAFKSIDGSCDISTCQNMKFLCKPKNPIVPAAIEVHGITDEQLENEPPFSYFAQRIIDFCKDAVIVTYNGKRFDIPILDRQLEECGFSGVFDESILFDVFELFKIHNSRTLTDAYKFYGLGDEIEGAHDALNDVAATVKIMIKQLEVEDDEFLEVAQKTCPLPQDRVGFSGHIEIDENKEPVLSFGKHKGTKLRDVNIGYLTWICSNDFPVATKKYIRNFLKESK